MYDKGQGVPQDNAKAAAWFQKAAEQGSDAAALWLLKAAGQGNAKAQFHLGEAYRYDGDSLPQSAIHTYAWCNLAADAIEEGEECRSLIKKSMTPVEIAEGQALSEKLFQQIPLDN